MQRPRGVSSVRATLRPRALAWGLLIGIGAGGCSGGSGGSGGREGAKPGPIAADTAACKRCVARKGGCFGNVEYGCGPKDSCKAEVSCDPSCCSVATQPEDVALTGAPWGEILAARAATEPPPLGVLADDGHTIGIVDVDTGALIPILHARERISSYAWAAEGARLVLRVEKGVVSVDLVTQEQWPRGATMNIVSTPTGVLLHEAYAQQWFRDLGTAEPILLEAPIAKLAQPIATDDGRRVLGHRDTGHPGGPWHLFDADQLPVALTAESRFYEKPSWHPSGEFFLAWSRDDGEATLIFSSPNGRRRARTSIVRAGVGDGFAISADGTWIAFGTDGSRGSALEIAPLGALDRLRRVDVQVPARHARWIPPWASEQLRALEPGRPPMTL